MKNKLFIYGAGGLGREVLALIKALPDWEPAGFFDDGIAAGTHVAGIKVLGGLQQLLEMKSTAQVVIAIGDPKVKAGVAKSLAANQHIQYPVLIHPNALIMDKSSIKLGDGSIITAGVKMTCDINIGKHVLINLNTTLGHDVQIGDYSSVMPGANLAGAVQLGKGVLIGSGANILNGLHVADAARIGSGAVVTKNVSAGITVVGVPAKERKLT
ncbi:MAG TPA: acetyltransferase [Cyclobacteriaceae bacterium]|nr:acetyltransferase [Cyclobacteriaceae bacterium]